MLIERLIHRKRTIAQCLLWICIQLVLPVGTRAGETSQEGKSSNVTWSIQDDLLVIMYDLSGEEGSQYEIDVVMKRENDPSFIVQPRTVEGDIGPNCRAGTKKAIRWFYRRDNPQGFQGEGYYFEITVKPVEKSSPMMYYVLGAAVVTGGLVAILAGSHADQNPVGNLLLPGPPSRP